MMRDFNQWLSLFRETIADYKYYINFDKVFINVNEVKDELNILNSLIGDPNIDESFERIVTKYPTVLKCIPILLAKRENEIFAMDEEGAFKYTFDKMNYSVEQYKVFMRKTGLFDLLQNHLISNLVDFVTGVETGLDSNGRKNRGGDLMENLVESYLIKSGLIKGVNYFKEMYIHEIENIWHLDLSAISNQGKSEKRFDFVVKGRDTLYGIETNFYASSGSKLNETARSYKTIALETRDIKNFKFIWITDGQGWNSARFNLQETFDVLEDLYCIDELEKGILTNVLK